MGIDFLIPDYAGMFFSVHNINHLVMSKKKIKKESRIIPAGTQQETGVSRFIKRKKLTEKVRIIKDAKANNESEISELRKPESDA
jgi:hypothetical protein